MNRYRLKTAVLVLVLVPNCCFSETSEIDGNSLNSTNIRTIRADLGEVISTTWLAIGESESSDDASKEPHFAPTEGGNATTEVNSNHQQPRTPDRNSVKPLIVTLILVFDQSAYRQFGMKAHRVHKFCRRLVNHMNSRLKKLFVKVVLVDVVIWNEKDTFEISSDSSKTMRDFAWYNIGTLMWKSSHSHAQLITGKDQKGENVTILGKAGLNSICTLWSSSVIMLLAKNYIELQATINVHEIAHSLNIDHADRECTECIMVPGFENNQNPPNQWTVANVKDFMSIVEEKTCLFMDQPMTFAPNSCGNGVVDLGEECDIGQRDKDDYFGDCDAWTFSFFFLCISFIY